VCLGMCLCACGGVSICECVSECVHAGVCFCRTECISVHICEISGVWDCVSVSVSVWVNVL
jgi:hypothetical protein